MFINFNALIVSIVTIVAVDAIAADRALATIGSIGAWCAAVPAAHSCAEPQLGAEWPLTHAREDA